MEHLFLPHGAVLPKEDTVRYQGSTEYLECTFVDFVVIQGYSFLLDTIFTPVKDIENYAVLTTFETLTAFLQEWLFCSLLKEIFDVIPHQLCGQGFYRHTDFFRHVQYPVSGSSSSNTEMRKSSSEEDVFNDEYFLCTNDLPRLAVTWMEYIKPKLSASEMQYRHLARCIDNVHKTLNYLDVMKDSIKYDSKTRIIIAATCDFVVAMITKTYGDHEITKTAVIEETVWEYHCWRRTYIERMVDLGWCRREAVLLTTKFPFVQVTHFCRPMKRADPRDHSKCTEKACRSTQSTGMPQHVPTCASASTQCGSYSIERDDMKNMLYTIRSNGLPVLKMQKKSNKLEMDLVPRRPGEKYIALSHVWSDGMGNKFNNSLPMCQLESLYSKICRIPPEVLPIASDGRSVLVWIDTLCCPVDSVSQNGEKDKVLGQMRQIYTEADLVFVLDAELQCIDSEPLSVMELGFRILISNWMSRLWTLQEGYLAKRIWIQFRDKACNLDQAGISKIDLGTVPVNRVLIATTVRALYMGLRIRHAQSSADERRKLTFPARSLQDRSVTVSSDEPICLATLFGLDVNTILKVDKGEANCTDKRMGILWTLMQNSDIGIPKSLLFDTTSRSMLEGFHWAPASLLKQFNLFVMLNTPPSPTTKVTLNGLHIQSEGFVFPRYPKLLRCLQKHRDLRSINVFDNSNIVLRDNFGRWFIMLRYRNQKLETDESRSLRIPHTSLEELTKNRERAKLRETVGYAIMLRNELTEDHLRESGYGPSLLVAVHSVRDQAQSVTMLETINTKPILSEQIAVWEYAYQLVAELRADEDFKAIQKRDMLRGPITTAGSAIEDEIADSELVREMVFVMTTQRLADNPDMMPILQRIGYNNQRFGMLVLIMISGTFALDVEFKSSDFAWCVD